MTRNNLIIKNRNWFNVDRSTDHINPTFELMFDGFNPLRQGI